MVHRGVVKDVCCALILASVFALPAQAAKLQIKLRAINPVDEPRPVEVRSQLPVGVTTNDILSTAGLDVGYDVKSDSYYVYGTLELGPKEIAVRDVEIRDIWVVEEDEIQALSDRATTVAQALGRTDQAAVAREKKEKAATLADTIVREQRANSIVVVPPVQHIAAYEGNLVRLGELRASVGKLEDLALAEGIDVGDELMGSDPTTRSPRTRSYLPDTYGEVTLQISVLNTALATPKPVNIKRVLPREIGIEDVLNPGGLTVREDSDSGRAYLAGDGSTLAPGESKVFTVILRDKWNVYGPRIAYLEEDGTRLLRLSRERNKLKSVRNTLETAMSRLGEIRDEQGPSAWSSEYVAFYRQQGRDLDEVEALLNRVDKAIVPIFPKKGFDIPAPDPKTTWLVIWCILGFLAIVTLLFFIRWFGRSSS